MALDDELKKVKEDLKNHPPWSRADYEKGLRYFAEKHRMSVERFKRMLDEGLLPMEMGWRKALKIYVLRFKKSLLYTAVGLSAGFLLLGGYLLLRFLF